MLLDILMIYLFVTLNLPIWFLVIVIIDVIIRTAVACVKK